MYAFICVLASICTDGSKSYGLVTDSVDVIEINHFINDDGVVQLDQVIFYDWSPSQSRYYVRAWRSLKSPSQLPYKTANGYEAIWHDSRDGNIFRRVRAKTVIETWTNYDPETVNQEYLDRNLRRELLQRKSEKPTKLQFPVPFHPAP